jgi:HSP20 family protein
MSIRSFFPALWPASHNGSPDPFMSLRHEIDRAFESFGRTLPSVTWPHEAVVPRINVTRKDTLFQVKAELPGVEIKDVELLVDDEVLTIRGEKKSEVEDKTEERHIFECAYGAFTRTIPLPFSAKPRDVSAAFKNGVLTVTIPIPADVQPKAKKVEIQAAA